MARLFSRLARLLKTLAALAVLLLLAAVVALGMFLTKQRSIISSLEGRIGAVKATTVPLRFMVLSRSDSSISARFRFYDADGRDVASFERAWNGSELAVDSLLVPVGGRYLAFPVRVFTDAVAPRRGTELFPYYDRDGFPAIYDSETLDDATRAALADLFSKLKTAEGLYRGDAEGALEKPLRNLFGNAVHDLQRFRRFEVGTVYSLVVHSDGGIEILRD